MTNPSSVNFQKFAAMLKTKRAGRGLRQAAEEIGAVSASTLSRIEQGNVPDLETFMRICQWLGASADEFRFEMAHGQSAELPEPEEVIEAHLRADRTLPPEAIDALSQMIRYAYKAAKAGRFNQKED
jgi:transcriptional regulator with XRE-family HTH domain